MTKKYWLSLTPSMVIALAIILSSLVAVLAAKSTWLALAAPALLALAVAAADALNSRLRGRSFRPSPAALILAASFLVAGLLVTFRDPHLVKSLIPIVGVCAWTTLLLRPENRRNACTTI